MVRFDGSKDYITIEGPEVEKTLTDEEIKTLSKGFTICPHLKPVFSLPIDIDSDEDRR